MGLPRKKILKPIRLALLMVAVLVFAGSVYGLAAASRAVYLTPTTVDQQVPVYQYTHKGSIDYAVYLKPSSIFQENPLGPGKSYYSRLLDHISLNYSYLFTADQETELDGTYAITATLEAKDMWQKDFVLVPATPFSGKGKDFSFNKNFDLTLSTFKQYMTQVNQELGVSAPEPKLIVKLAISMKGEAQAGSLNGSLVPTMVVPLTEGQFKIDGKLSDEKSDSISTTETVTDPDMGLKKSRLLYFAISTVVLGAASLALLLFTKGKPVPPVDEEVAIQKKYGSRLVKVPGELRLGDQSLVVSFISIDELVKVADELGKPLIKVDSAAAGLVSYFVFDGQVVYQYRLALKKRSLQFKKPDFPASL